VNQPNVLLFIGFALGLFVAGTDDSSWFWAGAGMILVVLVYTGKWREGLLLAGAVAFGLFYWSVRVPEVPPLMATPKRVEVTGTVSDFPAVKPDRTSFYLHVNSGQPGMNRLRVVVRSAVPVQKGDYLSLKGQLETVREPGNPGEFNYKKYLERRQVYYILTVKKPDDLRVIGRSSSFIQYLMLSARAKGEAAIERYLPKTTAAIAKGIVLGTSDEIDPQDYGDFQKTGLAHILAASGMNVGFVMLMGVWTGEVLKLRRRTKGVLAAVLVLGYGCLTGWPVSLLRAALMAWLGLLAYYGGREPNLPNALAVSGLIMLVLNPVWLFELSFQLSFLATWGLIWLYPAWRQMIPYQGKVVDAILIPLAAQAATLPIIVHSFSLFSFSSLFANIFGAYLSGAALILGLIGFLVSTVFAPLAAVFLLPAGLAVDVITEMSRWLSYLPGSYLWVAAPPFWSVIGFYAGLVCLSSTRVKTDKRLLALSCFLLVVYLGLLLVTPGFRDKGWLEVTFLDVGQGDSILVKTPQGRFMLVDCGGNQLYDVGEKVVVPALARKGLRSLDMLVITHPDIDHIGGASTVIREMRPRVLGVSDTTWPGYNYQELQTGTQVKTLKVVELSQGQAVRLDPDLAIDVLYPEPSDEGRISNQGGTYNSDSVVMRLRYGRISFLLTGDIDGKVMDRLVAKKLIEPTTVVKAPHHGSRGSLSEAFYKAASPKVAVISVGEGNPFGHPSLQTLELLNDSGVKIYRTDLDGALTFKTDGGRLFVQTTKKHKTFSSSTGVFRKLGTVACRISGGSASPG